VKQDGRWIAQHAGDAPRFATEGSLEEHHHGGFVVALHEAALEDGEALRRAERQNGPIVRTLAVDLIGEPPKSGNHFTGETSHL
jgi:hypothetical protein